MSFERQLKWLRLEIIFEFLVMQRLLIAGLWWKIYKKLHYSCINLLV